MVSYFSYIHGLMPMHFQVVGSDLGLMLVVFLLSFTGGLPHQHFASGIFSSLCGFL